LLKISEYYSIQARLGNKPIMYFFSNFFSHFLLCCCIYNCIALLENNTFSSNWQTREAAFYPIIKSKCSMSKPVDFPVDDDWYVRLFVHTTWSTRTVKPSLHELHFSNGVLILDWATLPRKLLIALPNIFFFPPEDESVSCDSAPLDRKQIGCE